MWEGGAYPRILQILASTPQSWQTRLKQLRMRRASSVRVLPITQPAGTAPAAASSHSLSAPLLTAARTASGPRAVAESNLAAKPPVLPTPQAAASASAGPAGTLAVSAGWPVATGPGAVAESNLAAKPPPLPPRASGISGPPYEKPLATVVSTFSGPSVTGSFTGARPGIAAGYNSGRGGGAQTHTQTQGPPPTNKDLEGKLEERVLGGSMMLFETLPVRKL